MDRLIFFCITWFIVLIGVFSYGKYLEKADYVSKCILSDPDRKNVNYYCEAMFYQSRYGGHLKEGKD